MLICHSGKRKLIHATERVGTVIGDAAGCVGGTQGSWFPHWLVCRAGSC